MRVIRKSKNLRNGAATKVQRGVLRPSRAPSVRVASWNLRGISNKCTEVSVHMTTNEIDILAVQETFHRVGSDISVPNKIWITDDPGITEGAPKAGTGVGFIIDPALKGAFQLLSCNIKNIMFMLAVNTFIGPLILAKVGR